MSGREVSSHGSSVLGLFGAVLVGAGLMTAACSDDEGAPATPTEDAGSEPTKDSGISTSPTDAGIDSATADDSGASSDTECTVTITPNAADAFVELCKPASGTVKHVRLTGVKATEKHGFAQVLFGLDTAPASSQAGLEADQFRVTLYAGNGFTPPALVQATFGAKEETLVGDAAFVRAGGTVCFDVHDGEADKAPYFAIWVDGQKGASCSTRSTLTAASAYGTRNAFGGAVGVIAKDAKIYFGQTGGLATAPTITLSSVAAVAP